MRLRNVFGGPYTSPDRRVGALACRDDGSTAQLLHRHRLLPDSFVTGRSNSVRSMADLVGYVAPTLSYAPGLLCGRRYWCRPHHVETQYVWGCALARQRRKRSEKSVCETASW